MNRHFFNTLLLFLVGLCAALPLCAETYSWTDDQGTVNFTENYSNIPKKYRKIVHKREDIEYGKPLTQNTKSAGKDVNTATGQPEKQIKAATDQSRTEPQGVFGGKKGEEWGSELRAKNTEILLLEQKIRQTEELLKKPTGLNKDQVNRLPQDLVSLISQRNDAIKNYNELNDKANNAGVPAEFRK